jgi:hypothetical protein
MMVASFDLFSLGREEQCCLLGALLLVVNVSSQYSFLRCGQMLASKFEKSTNMTFKNFFLKIKTGVKKRRISR